MHSITFTKPDDPQSVSLLLKMVEMVQIPILCLILKVNEKDEIMNIELTDEHTVKSLALVSAVEAAHDSEKE